MTSYQYPDDQALSDLIDRMSEITEALNNLIYLICADADHPDRVRYFAKMSEERLQAMMDLLRSEAPRIS